ncbi:hypothetical protein B0H14DRAFT_2659294 [Mycena olivaceomarginata]|nr:hypothetical protein B0H14DRAFT_2659294 [Mycena olivaceomarginata]
MSLDCANEPIHASGESLLSRAASRGNSRVELTIPLTLRRRASQFSLPAIHEFYPGFKRNWSIHADGTYTTFSPWGSLRDPRGMMGEKGRVVVAHSLAGFEWLGVVCVGYLGQTQTVLVLCENNPWECVGLERTTRNGWLGKRGQTKNNDATTVILRPGEFNPVIEVMIKTVTNAGQENWDGGVTIIQTLENLKVMLFKMPAL